VPDAGERKLGDDGRMTRPARWLAGLLTVTGTAHLVAAAGFDQMIPSFLGPARPWVYGSGLVELACAAGLAVPQTRRAAGWATAALFVAVFPGNVTMAVTSGDHAGWYQAAAWARLPLQVPLVWWAVSVARGAEGGGSATHEVPVEQEAVVLDQPGEL